MKILIGMSGGVDSSVAALLMKRAGHECIGCTLKLHEYGKDTELCGSASDLSDAARICSKLGIRHEVFDFCHDFDDSVVSRFINAYEHGETPNPCVDCNRFMKFDKLISASDLLGADAVVSGHYVRGGVLGDRYTIRKALDENKDQSYVLALLSQQQLSRIIFPLGEYTKEQIRAMAEEAGFENHAKPDSQDICFIPDGDYVSFIESRTAKAYEPGSFLNEQGDVIGTHRGCIAYTVGQRKGLGISAPAPLYVTKIDVRENTVTLGSDASLYKDSLSIADMNYVSYPERHDPYRATVKVRYKQKEVGCTVYPDGKGGARIALDTPVRAITPGQIAVIYDGEYVVAGARIVR